MAQKKIPYYQTNFFSKLICDYIEGAKSLEHFYKTFPSLANFLGVIEKKQGSFSLKSRKILTRTLLHQYSGVSKNSLVEKNIIALENPDTFTVTTGHQLNILSGPLFFIYKIITTINIAFLLNKKYKDKHFVPIYWMATEDHDFEEINHFVYKEKNIRWDRPAGGAVGDFITEGLDGVFSLLKKELKNVPFAAEIEAIYKQSYLESSTLAEATRKFVHILFQEYGLVIIDANCNALKKAFIPYIKEDIFENTCYKEVNRTIGRIKNRYSKNYRPQVSPREINFFYLGDKCRNRIILKKGVYEVEKTSEKFKKSELVKEIDTYPERFSPNVLLRPLYQEIILPNICYIGGGGEIAYWLELKSFFDSQKVEFPVLLLRNSVLFISEKQNKKIKKLGVSIEDLFLRPVDLINKKIKEISGIKIDFSRFKEHLERQFKELYAIASQTDKSFLGSVAAQEKKQKKGIENLEKRLLKAQKRKLKDEVSQIEKIQKELFPDGFLQERVVNFTNYYDKMGQEWIHYLVKNLHPLSSEFSILTY